MTRMTLTSLVAALMTSTLAAVGCSSETPDDGSVTGPDQEVQAGSSASCTKKIEDTVLKAALEINETASIISSKPLYAEGGFADAVLVRVSDEVEPSDWIVVRSRMDGNVGSDAVCSMKHVVKIAEGLLPPDDALVDGKLGDACKKSIKDAVLKKALELSDTASITGTKLVYGGGNTFGGAIVVRVSDEVEPTDYIALFTTSGEGKCTVGETELLNEGVLPDIADLDPT